MSKGFTTTDIAGIARGNGWSPLRKELDVRAFGINAWTAREAGEGVIPEHDEVPSGHEELYLVTAGRATFTVDGEEIDAGPGSVVFVADPALKRGAVAAEAATTVVVVGGKPGEAYVPRAWEVNAEVFGLFDEEKYSEAKAMLTDALGRYEDRGVLLFNLACAEARLGDPDAAFEHLRAAMAERPDMAGYAREDGDLAPLRDDPRFDEILGAATPS